MADLFCLMISSNCFFILSLRQKQARRSGRAVTFGEERLIDETTHFPVWNDYRSQSEVSAHASLRLFLFLPVICPTELAVETKSRGRRRSFLEIFISSTSDTCVSSGGCLFTGLSFRSGGRTTMCSAYTHLMVQSEHDKGGGRFIGLQLRDATAC